MAPLMTGFFTVEPFAAQVWPEFQLADPLPPEDDPTVTDEPTVEDRPE